MESNKPNYYDLFQDRNKILKSKKRLKFNKRLNLKIIGGYTNNDLNDWIEYFLLKSKFNPKIDQGVWGPAYQNLNTIKKAVKFDYLIIINSFHDLLSDNNWHQLKISKDTIKKIYLNFFHDLEKNTKFSISTFDKPQIAVNTNEGNLNKIIDELNYFIIDTVNSKFPYGIVEENYNRNKDEYNNVNLRDWYSFGKIFGPQQSVNFSKLIASRILNTISPIKKLIILDLDNTLWGGVIGDSKIEDIQIGDETAQGRIYRDIQAYFKMLKDNGYLLAIVSKNEEKISLKFLKNKKNILKQEDFVTYRINWEKKYKNILSIQRIKSWFRKLYLYR